MADGFGQWNGCQHGLCYLNYTVVCIQCPMDGEWVAGQLGGWAGGAVKATALHCCTQAENYMYHLSDMHHLNDMHHLSGNCCIQDDMHHLSDNCCIQVEQ